MSPVLILSRLCLNRRFQFFGISETSSRRTSSTFLTVSSSITLRRPASAAFSVGTRDGHVVVQDLDREVLAPFSEDLHLLLLEHLAGAVVGIDDVVAELELDVLDFAGLTSELLRDALLLRLLVRE